LQGADAQKRATLRDAALQVAALIKDKKYAEAAQAAQRLPTLPENPAARKEKVKLLGPHLDVEELMSQFRSAKLGGLGIEALLDELTNGNGDAVPAAGLTDELRLAAYRTGVAAVLAKDHVPNMKPKEWLAYADAMQKSAVELAEAVQ